MVSADPAWDPGQGPSERAARTPDAYVFYTDTSGKVGSFDPEANPEYRFLADLEPCTEGWKWTAFAIVEVDELLSLPQTATPSKFGPLHMRRTRHFEYFGFARLRVVPRRADEVLSAINENTTDGYSGSAMVRGKFQVIVELGADSPEQVCERLKALQGVPGVAQEGVEAARVKGQQYFYQGYKRNVGELEETP